MNSNINFKAKYIMNVDVKRKDFLKKGYAESLSLLEFDKKSASDFQALIKLQEKWKPSFLEDILLHLTTIWRENSKIYLLTKQKQKFEKLIYQEILGVITANSSCDNQINIDFLQVSPEHLNNKYRRFDYLSCIFTSKFRYCGTAMLNCLKELYPNKKLTLLPSGNCLEFYEKNGFIKEAENSSKYIYEPNKQQKSLLII